MGKPHRSPLLGYNHNVSHLGRVFHVQTEDSGPATPRLFTHLFHEGTILASRKTEYEAMLPDDQVRPLMQAQHRQVIKDLAAGLLNDRIVAFFRSRGVELVIPPVAPRGTAPTASPVIAPVASAEAAPVAVVEAVPPAPVAPPPSVVVAETSPAAPAVAAPAPATPSGTGSGRPTAAPRRNTRPIEIQRTRKPTPAPVTVRPPEPRRPPFVRDVPATAPRAMSPDGVVVQRNVVIGGTSGSEPRPRIRPPVPYIVTGGTHVPRPPAAVDTARGARPAAAPVGDGKTRPPSAFGQPVPDDKSLDEVILEYLSEDGD
jgi:hypothetical protein